MLPRNAGARSRRLEGVVRQQDLLMVQPGRHHNQARESEIWFVNIVAAAAWQLAFFAIPRQRNIGFAQLAVFTSHPILGSFTLGIVVNQEGWTSSTSTFCYSSR